MSKWEEFLGILALAFIAGIAFVAAAALVYQFFIHVFA